MKDGDGGGGQITTHCSKHMMLHANNHFSPVMTVRRMVACYHRSVAVRHCHMLFHHTHILYSPVADVFGGRDDTS